MATPDQIGAMIIPAVLSEEAQGMGHQIEKTVVTQTQRITELQGTVGVILSKGPHHFCEEIAWALEAETLGFKSQLGHFVVVVVTHHIDDNLFQPHYLLSRIGIVMIPTQMLREFNKIGYENHLECSKISQMTITFMILLLLYLFII